MLARKVINQNEKNSDSKDTTGTFWLRQVVNHPAVLWGNNS